MPTRENIPLPPSTYVRERACCGVSTKVDDHFLTRRQMLSRIGMGLGALSLASLLDPSELVAGASSSASNPLAPRKPHFPGKAKSVIQIFAAGGPSQVDTWDPKPALAKMNGKPINDQGTAMASPFAFSRYGQSGLEASELVAKTAAHADDLTVIRSMWTDIPAHEPAALFMNTGALRGPMPSMGSWVVYGLGTENQNLPGFISLRDSILGAGTGGSRNYEAAFLPGAYQGTSINTKSPSVARMIQNIRNTYVSGREQRRQIDLIQELNAIHAENLHRESALESRIQAYEMAFRMQAEALDIFDISKESADTLAAYGPGEEARKLLIARRLVERGVRFVQVLHTGWDHHSELRTKLPEKAKEIDQPLAALLHDLKQRGLLDSTLVVWGGEFGRKPTQDPTFTNPGRDHNAQAFTVLLAGGGVKGGVVHGMTDEFSLAAVADKVHTHDLHATILHCLGIDHERLTFRHNGRDFRLTDVAGQVVKPILT